MLSGAQPAPRPDLAYKAISSSPWVQNVKWWSRDSINFLLPCHPISRLTQIWCARPSQYTGSCLQTNPLLQLYAGSILWTNPTCRKKSENHSAMSYTLENPQIGKWWDFFENNYHLPFSTTREPLWQFLALKGNNKAELRKRGGWSLLYPRAAIWRDLLCKVRMPRWISLNNFQCKVWRRYQRGPPILLVLCWYEGCGYNPKSSRVKIKALPSSVIFSSFPTHMETHLPWRHPERAKQTSQELASSMVPKWCGILYVSES